MKNIRLTQVFLPVAALCGLGVLGNVLSPELFFSVSLIFGSIATMFAILAYGGGAGVVVAAVASSYTFFLWGHPFAVVIFVVEALFVGLFAKRIRDIVVRDILFWLTLGWPLVILFYHSKVGVPGLGLQFLGLPLDSALSIFYKQALNGTLNALIASLVYILIQVLRKEYASMAIRSVIFNVTLACILSPMMVLVAHNADSIKNEIEEVVRAELGIASAMTHALFESPSADGFTGEWSEPVAPGLVALRGPFEDGVKELRSYIVMDAYVPNDVSGHPLSMTGLDVQERPSGLMIGLPSSEGAVASMKRWRDAIYFRHTEVGFGDARATLIVERSAVDVIDRLHANTNKLLYYMFIGVVAAAVLSFALGYVLSLPLVNLRMASVGILDGVRDGREVNLRRSALREVDALSTHFTSLASELRNQFKKIQDAGETLEEEVRARTNELEDQTERLDIALKSAQAGVWEYDLKGGELIWDDRMFELYGVNRDDFSHAYEAWSSALADEDKMASEALLQQAIRGEAEFTPVFRINLPKGGHRFIQAYARVIRDTYGAPLRMIGLNFDVTELHELQSETKLQSTILDATKNSVVVTTEDDRIEWVNRAFTELTGYTFEEVEGKWPGEFVLGAESDRETAEEIIDRLKSGQSVNTEIVNYRKDGTPFWVSLQIDPVRDEEGNVIKFCSIQTDISELKKTEEDLRLASQRANQMAEEAESANQAKSQFLANMSHEIRTPLNGIFGMADILNASDLSDDQKEYAETIMSCCDQLLAVINDVLDFSKISAGKLELEVIPLDLGILLKELDLVFGKLARERDLQFSCTIASSCPRQLLGDPTRLRQILFNLVGNAVKFTPVGSVVVEVSSVGCDSDAPNLKFSVRDTGIGIPSDRMDRLFRAFSQVDSGHSRQYGGTGLGLAISKSIAEAMGGFIEVSSAPGVGSVFSVTIPFEVSQKKSDADLSDTVAQSGEGARGPAGEDLDWGHLSILIAEDSVMNQKVTHRMLEKGYGCKMHFVENGVEAVDYLRKHEVDVVFMDCQMPVMNGFEATRQIRSDSLILNAQVPIVAMTANVMEQQRRECEEAGMDDFLAKPVKLEVIGQVFERLFAKDMVDERTGDLNA